MRWQLPQVTAMTICFASLTIILRFFEIPKDMNENDFLVDNFTIDVPNYDAICELKTTLSYTV